MATLFTGKKEGGMKYIIVGMILWLIATGLFWALAIVSKQADQRTKLIMEDREKHGINKRD